MPTVTLSDKGQITLPAGLRRKLGLRPHAQLDITLSDDTLVLRPVKSITDLAGIFADAARGRSTDWEEIRRHTEKAIAEEAARE